MNGSGLTLLHNLGLTSGSATGTAGLTTPLTASYQLFSQFLQDLQQVAQMILTLQDQTGSLVAAGLQIGQD